MVDLEQGENANYQWHRATIQVSKDGELLGTLEPEKRFYKASKQGTSEVGIRQRPNEDLYLNFGGMSDDNQRAVIQAYVFPLVSWIWIGGLVLIGGTLICLVPSKIKMQYARTQVVGIAKKHVDVTGKTLSERGDPRWQAEAPESRWSKVGAGAGACQSSLPPLPSPRCSRRCALAQTASEKPSPDVRRVGMRLACQCGCKDSVATCSMLECGFSKPAKERIARMQAAGISDEQIIDAFVRDYGPGIYLAPPSAVRLDRALRRGGRSVW